MTDYISKDALSELAGEPIEVFLGRLDLKLPPTVDVKPVRQGKWIDKNTPMHLYSPWHRFKCSVCGECDE